MNLETSLGRTKTADPAQTSIAGGPPAAVVPQQPAPIAKKMDSDCIAGFVESKEPYFLPEFSQDGKNSENPDWNTFDIMSVVRNEPVRRLILKFKDFRITISGHRLDPVILAIRRKRVTAISPSSPASIHDLRYPFIESVEIERLSKAE